jgi:hypothetical protein
MVGVSVLFRLKVNVIAFELCRSHHTSFGELSKLVSEDSNQQIIREVLKKVCELMLQCKAFSARCIANYETIYFRRVLLKKQS